MAPLDHDTEPTFADQADQASPGIVREFMDFLVQNKKWWLIPIVVVLLLLGAVLIIGGTAAGPFLYTLF